MPTIAALRRELAQVKQRLQARTQSDYGGYWLTVPPEQLRGVVERLMETGAPSDPTGFRRYLKDGSPHDNHEAPAADETAADDFSRDGGASTLLWGGVPGWDAGDGRA